MSRSSFRLLAATAAALLAFTLTGCSGAEVGSGVNEEASASPAPSSVAAEPLPAETDAALTLADPRTIVGASTARTVAEVEPIATDVAPRLPVTVTDESGTEVTITDVSRILALDVYGTIAETITGLGLGKNLVGRGSSNTLESMSELPLVTQNGHSLNGEAILGLAPTVVLIDSTIGPQEVAQQLRESGIPVVFFTPDRALATLQEQVRTIAHVVGLAAEGDALAERITAEIDEARTAIARMAPADEENRLRIEFLYVRGQAGVFFVFGDGTGVGDLIEGVGGIDVAAEAGMVGTRPANSEALLVTNPDLILVMTDGLESTGGIEGLLARPGVAETNAGQNRRIVDMADGQVLSFGPTTAAVMLSLAEAIYAPNELR